MAAMALHRIWSLPPTCPGGIEQTWHSSVRTAAAGNRADCGDPATRLWDYWRQARQGMGFHGPGWREKFPILSACRRHSAGCTWIDLKAYQLLTPGFSDPTARWVTIFVGNDKLTR